MATFEEAIEEQKRLLEEAKAEIKTLTEETFAGRREQLNIELQGLNARIEAEKMALQEARARGEATQEIEAEIAGLQQQMREEQRNFNEEQSQFQEDEEKKAKKRHAKSIRRLTALKGAYDGVKSVVSGIVSSLVGATLELEKQSQSFRKSTGGAMAFTKEISFASREIAMFGGTTADAAAMVGTLNDGFFGFQRISGDSRRTLIDLTADMSQLGVDAGTTAESIDLIMGTFQGSAKDVEAFALTIAGTAKNMGVGPEGLQRATVGMASRLAELGPRAMSTALEFQKMGRQFGVNADSLLAFSDKFETFDSAASTVSQLNASFGTQLNTIELMKMSETERAMAVMDNLKAQGTQFDQLSKYQQRNLAEITGLEVAELSRLNQNKEAFKTEQMEREKAEQQGKSYLSFVEKIRAFFTGMVLDMAPLVEGLMDLSKNVLDKLLQRSDNISKVYFNLSTRIFKPLGSVISHIGNVLAEKVLPLLDMTGGSAGSFGETLVGISEVISENLIGGIDYLANDLFPTLISIFNSPGVQGFIQGLKDTFGMILEGDFAGAMEKFKSAAMPAVKAIGTELLGVIKGALTSGAGTGALVGGGMLAGAQFGATIGSLFPGVGTLIGGAVGAAAGGLLGFFGPRMLLEQGGYAHQGGTTMVGERGPELLSVPRGSYVTNNEMMRSGITPPAAQAVNATNGGGSGQGVIHLYMDSKRFASAVIKNINDENRLTVV
jgi:hypothetical protein